VKEDPKRRTKLDRDLLHKYLWDNSDRLGRIKINVTDLSADLGISRFGLQTVFREFLAGGRMKEFSRAAHGIKIYTITDPNVWRWKMQDFLEQTRD